jgi:hypothetical protein
LAEGPSASDVIYLHNYFQNFMYFILQDTKSELEAAATANFAKIAD